MAPFWSDVRVRSSNVRISGMPKGTDLLVHATPTRQARKELRVAALNSNSTASVQQVSLTAMGVRMLDIAPFRRPK